MNDKKSVQIVAYNPHNDGSHLLNGMINCFQRSFAGPPWNEVYLCKACLRTYGEDEARKLSYKCTCNDKQMCEKWPAARVESHIFENLLTRPEEKRIPSSWIALEDDIVIGLCWGFTVTAQGLSERVRLPELADVLISRFGSDACFAYQNELAVVPEYRGQRIARKLVEARHNAFIALGATVGVIRTQEAPPTRTFEWYTKVGFEIIARYSGESQNVILARPYDGLVY